MFSNYDEKASKAEVSEGKRHYNRQKKTSLFGSESPRTAKTKSNHNRYTSTKNDTNCVEENILTQNEVLRRERCRESKKSSVAAEKRATLQELQSYNPWGKPGAGASNVVNHSNQNGNRSKWEYENELQKVNEFKSSDEKSYPGFAGGFGCGNVRKDGRRRSDAPSNNEEVKQNIYYPFGSPGGGAPMNDDKRKNQGATVTVHNNPAEDNESRQKYEEAQEYANHLEHEIQNMRLKQLEDRYVTPRNDAEDMRDDRQENGSNAEYEEDALYREAENRARLRELERLKESYEQGDGKYDTGPSNNDRRDECYQENNETYYDKNKDIPKVPLQQIESKRAGSSSTHNDYRPYSMEEYMNSRQQQVNPSQLKRTTLSGSEELNRNGNLRNGDSNHNFKVIDEDSIMKQQNIQRSYNNVFPSDRNFSANKVSGQYAIKAPYATD